MYELHLETWENDGDHGRTTIIQYLSDADVRFYIDLASKFQTKSLNKGGIGNRFQQPGVLAEVIKTVLAIHAFSHNPISSGLREKFTLTPKTGDELEEFLSMGYVDAQEILDEDAHELMCEVLGNPESDYGDDEDKHFCRAFESFKVFIQPVKTEDVTSQFTR